MKNPFTFTETLGLEPPMFEAGLFWIVCVVITWLIVVGFYFLTKIFFRRK